MPDTGAPIWQPAVETASRHPRSPTTPPLCPEISLLTRPELWADWQSGALAESIAPQPPYWAIAWPGGQALSRYLLDHPSSIVGRRVLDCGSGSGLVAIAAAMAGARQVVAADCDPSAVAAIEKNARINRVDSIVHARWADFASLNPDDFDIVLAADLWYERFSAQRVTAGLRQKSASGIDVLIGDNARAYTPRRGVTILAEYTLPVDPRIEASNSMRAYVAVLHDEISIS